MRRLSRQGKVTAGSHVLTGVNGKNVGQIVTAVWNAGQSQGFQPEGAYLQIHDETGTVAASASLTPVFIEPNELNVPLSLIWTIPLTWPTGTFDYTLRLFQVRPTPLPHEERASHPFTIEIRP